MGRMAADIPTEDTSRGRDLNVLQRLRGCSWARHPRAQSSGYGPGRDHFQGSSSAEGAPYGNSGVSKVEKIEPKHESEAKHQNGLHNRGIGHKKLTEEPPKHIPRPKSICGKKRRARSIKRTSRNGDSSRKRGKSRIRHRQSHMSASAEDKVDLLEKVVEGTIVDERGSVTQKDCASLPSPSLQNTMLSEDGDIVTETKNLTIS